MASGKTKNIDEIDDIVEMLQAMTALDISCKGLKTLDDMKARVRDEFKHLSAKTPSWTAGQAFSVLSEAIDEDLRKRQILLDLYTKAESCLDKMDEKNLSLLQQSIGNVREKLNSHKSQLTQKEYFLLVAGETSSGKSSLVNLILGEELLPHSVLSTTSTICEVKYGEERRIVAHFKDKDPETGQPTKTILLQGHPTTEQNYLGQISPYVHVKSEREKGSSFKKIELFWPHSLLQKRVVIIDSPGVGESDIMDEIVTQYLPQAFAFIYTINSANAGGVQKDRLEKLMEEVNKVTEVSLEQGQQQELTSKCALFVCNKWDQVPEKEVVAVKDHVIKKLKRRWPGLDPESQIIYMSTKKASEGQNLGFITEDFLSLMNGLKALVLKSIYFKLEMHWKWLYYLLSRIIYQSNAFVVNASRDRQVVLQKMWQVLLRLAVIEKQQSMVIKDLNEYLENRINDAIQQLSQYLSSDEVKARFTSWTLDEVPKVESSWEGTKYEIRKNLSSRLRDIIEQWEEDKQVFASARKSLVEHFLQRYNVVEEQLKKLQCAVTGENVDVPQDDDTFDLSFTLAEKAIIGVTSPIWFPLGVVALVIGVPVVGIIAIKEKVEGGRKIKKYEADKCGYMAKKSASYLDKATDGLVLQTYVNDQLEEAELCLKQIEARIPKLIQADKMLCDQLENEKRSQKEITDLYQPILDEVSPLRGQLSVFGIREVRTVAIGSDELDWKEDISSRLGSGAFGPVYQGMLKKHGSDRDQPVPVALKVYNDVLTPTNAIDIMAEVELLRKLEHPHIVKFYGTSLLKNMDTIRVILVMEKCKENLKTRIFEHPESIPGKSRDPAVAKEVCQWLKEITDALTYIHKQDIIHRDLNLRSILLTEENSVKVSDVGASKPAIDVTGTLAGTPLYIAPEVFYSEVHNCKADIYSLGIMLWEMWYGEQAFANAHAPNSEALFSLVDKGWRPTYVEGYKHPPRRWKQLMKQCWDRNPEKRPTAAKCYEEATILSSEIMPYMNAIANYDCTGTQTDQLSIEKGKDLKTLDDSKSARQMADNPENHRTVKQSSEHLVPQNPLTDSETVIAKYAYLPQHEDDLGFKKGDSINVLEKREDGWWKGRVEQKEGWFPSNYILVETDSAKPASNSEPTSALVNQSSRKVVAQEFSNKTWFWGKITRVDAEKLMKKTAADGDFLVRESKSKEGAYAVSLKAVGKIKHFLVTLEDGKVKVGAKNFNSLEEFIEHFKRFPPTDKAGNKMFLVKPFEESAQK